MSGYEKGQESLQLRSLVKETGELELSLVSVPIPEPAANEVLVRISASPLNPSDLGLLLGPADMSTAKASGTADRPIIRANIPEKAMRGLAARVGQSMPVGNEGSGTVVAAGSDPAAQALLHKTVAVLAGAMYAQYRCVHAGSCFPLPDGATAAQGASAFVNPLTALGMVDTMRREGHTALVHTAAASSLGQMLNRVCQKDGVELVNVVRKKDQEDQLRAAGAKHVCDTSRETFMADLIDALVKTKATIAFDAIGGGKLANQILTCMEAAINKGASAYNRYGSATHKQVYIYGGLDVSPTEISRSFGMAWGVGGWLVMPYLMKIGAEASNTLKKRVAAELTTTFATHYAKEVSLAEALQLDVIAGYAKRSTGEKYLIVPNKD